MHKIALVLAIAAVGEGLLALHLVKQLHEEREGAQALQARVAELERRAPQGAAGASFVAVPSQVATSALSVGTRSVPEQAHAPVQLPHAVATTVPNEQDLREQMNAAMERQRNLLKDPEYREALQTQQKMMLKQQNPDVARDLNLTPEQVERLFGTLAEQSMRSMETLSMWEQQGSQASAEELQRRQLEQQSANETELKNVLGEAKYREWMDYQTTAPARYEASRLRALLADAGVPLDQSLAKPLQKVLLEHQRVEQERIQQYFGMPQGSANSTKLALVTGEVRSAVGPVLNSEEHMEEMQRRQRDKLARVLTPEQLKVIEDEQNAQLQLQRVQTKVMRAQQGAIGGEAAQSGSVYFAPNETVEPAVDD
jgi:hypothetical protein